MGTYAPYVKVWDIVGYTYNGGCWCAECAHESGIKEWADRPADVWAVMPAKFGDQPLPVFVSDDHADLVCDRCLVAIDSAATVREVCAWERSQNSAIMFLD